MGTISLNLALYQRPDTVKQRTLLQIDDLFFSPGMSPFLRVTLPFHVSFFLGFGWSCAVELICFFFFFYLSLYLHPKWLMLVAEGICWVIFVSCLYPLAFTKVTLSRNLVVKRKDTEGFFFPTSIFKKFFLPDCNNSFDFTFCLL